MHKMANRKTFGAGFGAVVAYAHQVGGRALRMAPVYNAEMGGGGGGGDPWQTWNEPAPQQQQLAPQQPTGNTTENNNNNSFDFNQSIWETPNSAGNGTQQPTNQGTQQQPQQQPQEHNAFLDAHIAQMNLTNGLNFDAMAQGGDPEVIKTTFNSFAKNAYLGIMRDVNAVMEQRINDAVTKAVEKSTGTVQSWQAVERMQSALPFTSDPNIAPVANSVLQKFLGKGQPLELAIKNTGEYFRNMSSRIGGGAPEGNSQRPGSNPNRGYVSNQQGNSPTKRDEDWMGFLTAR
jgi:hypothetical protein